MKTITVEARKDSNVRLALDTIAEVCEANGYRVQRWRGPLSGRVPYRRTLRRCDLAILFNGEHPAYAPAIGRLRQMQAPSIYVELGWFPQQSTLQIDTGGINASASWVDKPLTSRGGNSIRVPVPPNLLLLLQHDHDTQITNHSPWFSAMEPFVDHVCRNSALSVSVRPHPRHPPSDSVMHRVARSDRTIDQSGSLADALGTCRAVACINSSSAVEALDRRIPVHCYGRSIYRHAGAVYGMDADGRRTRAVIQALAEGRCELFESSMNEIVQRIVSQQWTLDDIPIRLPRLISGVLASRDLPSENATNEPQI